MGVFSNLFFIKATNFIGGHKLLLYIAFYIANFSLQGRHQKGSRKGGKGRGDNRSEPQGRWQC